jgi:hypothetical protein
MVVVCKEFSKKLFHFYDILDCDTPAYFVCSSLLWKYLITLVNHRIDFVISVDVKDGTASFSF